MIRLIEVGPRDGLQNEKVNIATSTKIDFVNALSQTGVSEIEVSSFVSPEWIPQLKDADLVFAQIIRNPKVIYSALVPNMRGMQRALDANVDKISVFTAASNTFNQKNVNTDIAGTFRRMTPVVQEAKARRMPVRGYISTALWCPYEGPIAPEATLQVAQRLLDLGVDEVSIGDTIGKATPHDIQLLLDLMLSHISTEYVALHCHDTYGRGVSNVLTAYRMGIVAFDCSVAGLGGCPYAPGAPGNVATHDVIQALQAAGAMCKINSAALDAAQCLITKHIPRFCKVAE